MHRLGLALVIAISVTACNGGGDGAPAPGTGVAPKDAASRIVIPAKCKNALTFDKECNDLFDKAFGPGAGSNERARLNTERAYGSRGAYKKSTAKPAPKIGENQ